MKASVPLPEARRERTFRDKEGFVWDVSLDVGLCEDIDKADFSLLLPKEKSKIVLLDGERSDIALILGSTPLLFAIIWIIVQEQVAKHKIVADSEDELQRLFVRRMNGAATEEAREAFIEALSDFFPAAKTGLSKLWTTMKTSQEKMASRLVDLDPEIAEALERKMDKALAEVRKELAAL